MRGHDSFETILLHRLPVDGRKQINGLAQIVKDEMGHDPLNGSLFIFTSKKKDVLRMLYWDRTGFAMWVKRLEKDKFLWPQRLDFDVVTLTVKELDWLLDGLDILRMRPHQTLHFQSV